ncbi:MAG: YybH family protein [Gemmatimonadota bacterium]
MYRWIFVALILCVPTACSDAANDAAEATALDEAAIRNLERELIEADRRFAASVERSGLGAWITAFAPSGRMIADGQSYVGPEGIRRAMLPVYADTSFSITWDPNYAEVASSGDLGYTVGRYEQRTLADGEPVVESGAYLTVWRRQEDGSWKVKADIGNADAGD